ncbi:MAG: helix-turn-helix domain-containing protein, partial [Rhodospirillales bacterium]|nr:helix-turn-helix domain-containing protein [Rhodospirillales bacterium]
MASTETEQQPFREGGTNSGVGSLLKTTRQALGRDLVDVAYGLRIRHTYLMAIEDGRFGDLPGPTYAIGFVRAYAEYLGLDPREVIRRLKMETEGNLGGRNELVFPSPVSEGRFPQGAIIFIGLVLAAVLYTLQLMSSQERSIADMVPSIPDSFKTVLNDGQPAPAGEATQPGQGGKSPDEGQVSQPAVKA